jgi:hypothetical protein
MSPRTLTILAVACAVVATLAACTEADHPQVATAQSAPAAAAVSSSPSPADSDYDKALKYVRCMNAKGVKLPDPVEGKPLPLLEPGANPGVGGWEPIPPQFQECKHLMPTTWPVKEDPALTVKLRAYRACMHDEGVEVPGPDGNGMVRVPSDLVPSYSFDYVAADGVCKKLYLGDD